MTSRGVKESERYIVMDGCMFLNKCPTKMCLAKQNITNNKQKQSKKQTNKQKPNNDKTTTINRRDNYRGS